MRWPKYWSFSFSISPSSEHPGLISFRMDWLDLLAVQGTLKSLLQQHSSKASILRHSAFFTVQRSHPYMTTGKRPRPTLFPFTTKSEFLWSSMSYISGRYGRYGNEILMYPVSLKLEQFPWQLTQSSLMKHLHSSYTEPTFCCLAPCILFCVMRKVKHFLRNQYIRITLLCNASHRVTVFYLANKTEWFVVD